jgi:predicted nucleic acid-binding protein
MLRYTFFDASVAVKLVLHEEEGVNHVLNYFGRRAGICITSLCLMETLRVLKTKKLQKKEYLNLCHGLLQDVDRDKPRLVDTPMVSLEVFKDVEEIALRYQELDLSDALQIVSMKRGIFALGVDGSKTLLATADRPLQAAAEQEGLLVWNCLDGPGPV